MLPVTDIERVITPAAEALGFEVVQVRWLGDRSPTLQIMAERPDGSMNADDCAKLSRSVSALLDVEDLIAEHYVLEVSSPGIGRPLVRLKDFERFAGFQAKIETREPIEGRRRFRGRLLATGPNQVTIGLEDGPVDLPYDQIATAKLVVTDELLNARARAN